MYWRLVDSIDGANRGPPAPQSIVAAQGAGPRLYEKPLWCSGLVIYKIGSFRA